MQAEHIFTGITNRLVMHLALKGQSLVVGSYNFYVYMYFNNFCFILFFRRDLVKHYALRCKK